MSEIQWITTPVAVQRTGRSRSQLMRLVKAGYLTQGKHFLKGPYQNSPITWNVDAIHETMSGQAPMPAPTFKAVQFTEQHENV